MTKNNHNIADVEKITRWSPVWIVPIVTALIGAWILFYHFSHQGPVVTLVTTTAEGLEAGKTKIKSRSVDVGVVETVTLSDDLSKVRVQARLNAGMDKLLRQDTAFWVVKPQIGREGVSGLGTLLSGAYIELQPGNKGKDGKDNYPLLDAPPLASPDAKGLRIVLDSEKSGQLNAGDPVLFHNYRVGSVETSYFDPKVRAMRYQLFISAPYDQLVTSNVRFWKDSGVAFDMSAQGMRVEMGSLATLFSGGVSFDVPDGWDKGELAKEKAEYQLFDNQRSIQDSLYTVHKDYLMFFSDSVRGLQPGAPVEFRGIRLGTVAEVPFFKEGIEHRLKNDYRIPVLIHIEPERLKKLGKDFDFDRSLKDAESRGIRASLKSANLLTGSLYIDLDFNQQAPPWEGPHEWFGYPLIPTASGGLAQIQQKLMQTLDKINAMPLNPMINEATKTLAESQKTMKSTQKTMKSLNDIISSKEVKALPQDLQKTLQELNRSMKGFQPGSPAYNKMVGDMQRLDQVLRELQPVLHTLNEKSNALVFEAAGSTDPQPKKATK
ncbi:MAG: intermembrane transport protein PqiB [Serratia marcescens]|uniref:intermembrane transport protein PqiB n=1 Tax=Serratia marcescens TaxID=615 RepID=UPI000A38DFD1|nr:intermembrane transport protein PqiB [Serratia marcescens]AVN36098.1 intermembrane transport protein PqiB [Serratia marcescens]EGS5472203.1 intermembrane transport protein PqiB [Serratia marcescens]EGT0063161.1 intermembrane transport protein PqiB [Serratia marcescens]MBH2755555.1 intermembrane transport protein PqiB [Serratia marcescens]MBN5222304.1 intermembrane transport protein PqiB [Serratia marcescens]